jgi:hypothetical protein
MKTPLPRFEPVHAFYGTVRLFRFLRYRHSQPDWRWYEVLILLVLLPVALIGDLLFMAWDIRGIDVRHVRD